MYNGKVELTKEAYNMLLGLKKMAENYETLLKGIQEAVVMIIKEENMNGNPITEYGDGWAGELVYTDLSVDEFLQRTEIVVI